MSNQEATVKEIDVELALGITMALVATNAINKSYCEEDFRLNSDRINHFKNRMIELGSTSDDAAIVILSVDDENGQAIAGFLMPDYDWQEIRDRGEKPFARGLVSRDFIQSALEYFDMDAAIKLNEVHELTAVVVVDFGVAEIFEV